MCCMMLLATTACAQEVIQLYEGAAPGSESWTWQEYGAPGGAIVVDVVKPTLTVYPAEKPNGIAMVVCPGGAFHMLSVAAEGENLSKYLNSKGITCFVLKYRLCHADNFMERMQHLNLAFLDSVSAEVVPMTIQDALTAIRYVRSNAVKYGIDPHKIGIEGSSAGGTVSLGSAMACAGDDCRPDYVVGTYPYKSPHIGQNVPKAVTPLFIATATDDAAVPVQHSLYYYNKWLDAGQPVEMHLYKEGNHGFVGQPTGKNVDTWQSRLVEWLEELYPNK